MRTLEIKGASGSSAIRVGERLGSQTKYIVPERTVIITDTNVRRYYEEMFPRCSIITVGTGEKIKTLETAGSILEELIGHGADRSVFLLGIGGGIVCDITGFVASIYLRGVRYGFVASTLLAQADASVGGKNGVNIRGYKNMAGVFNQPEFVICDPELLKTLPKKEVQCGFAEIVKHAAIADKAMFGFLEENYRGALALDPEIIEKLVYDSVRIKASVVNRDEKEKGERRKLNFGHTLGHAIEKAAGVSHGEAVAAGMKAASDISVRKGLLSAADAKRIENLLANLGLPTEIPADKQKLMDALGKDKKREGDIVHFVLLNGIGNAVVENISIRELLHG